jgi:hypothetical protein
LVIQTIYGQKHTAIHNDAVNVGERYILNSDGYTPGQGIG